jgi:Tol biopolymer transport system component
MHSGKEVKLSDARITARDKHGKVLKDYPAPIAVSGDGQSVAYFRTSDNRLVVRDLGGKVHVIAEEALPKKIGMEEVNLKLSLDGGHLAVEYNDANDTQPTQVYDVSAPSHPGTIPGGLAFQNFGGDGSVVLVSKTTDNNTTELFTYGADGGKLSQVEPPQVVANNSPYGLASDNKTVAFFSGGAKKLSLRLYDIDSDAVTQTTRVKLGGPDLPEMIDWNGDNEITVHVSHSTDSGRTTMRILLIDPQTGAIKVRDSYKVKSDSFTYAACGG